MYKTIEQQFLASLSMLRGVVDLCPDALWFDNKQRHSVWHIAYHATFYADLYTCINHKAFRHKEFHIDGCHSLDFKNSKGEILVEATGYPKPIVVDYIKSLEISIGDRIGQAKLEDESGFPWIPMNKLGLHIYNIRHIQHHMAQLNERVVAVNGCGVGWVGKVG